MAGYVVGDTKPSWFSFVLTTTKFYQLLQIDLMSLCTTALLSYTAEGYSMSSDTLLFEPLTDNIIWACYLPIQSSVTK